MTTDKKFTEHPNSSNIAATHYDPQSRTMTVRFRNGGEYQYGGVVQDTYDGLVNAESIGKHFHKHIRSGDYKWQKAYRRKED